MISRREFLKLSQTMVAASLLAPSITACSQEHNIKGEITGGNASLGHRLRTMDFPKASKFEKTGTIIIGGGVSGLSAARYLNKYTSDFRLLEMYNEPGGNSIGGSNTITAFPWGAHYLPIPGNEDAELIQFLSEAQVITGIKNGLPVFNEYHLCHDPKERLFINNFWQEGIVPHEGVPLKDREQIQRFLELMHRYKDMTGSDGKPAFTIPIANCSRDKELLALDQITASSFLTQHNFTSPYLDWYVRYCCADDFGTSLLQTSAWAMIHYFASRKGKAANASSDAVLTWPEGNFWLVNQLKKTVQDHIQSNSLVFKVEPTADGITCLYFDAENNVTVNIMAKNAIIATPQFVTQRLLVAERNIDYTAFEYAPWMVANITTSHPLNERHGETLCWDNVIYGSNALGYVNALHQNVNFPGAKRVITYYKPLISENISDARKHARSKNFNDWKNEIIQDLSRPHLEIENHIEEMNVWIWGHGMIKPGPSFIWSDNLNSARRALDHKIFFAHSDLSGISIFEEAFYQGYQAAKQVLAS